MLQELYQHPEIVRQKEYLEHDKSHVVSDVVVVDVAATDVVEVEMVANIERHEKLSINIDKSPYNEQIQIQKIDFLVVNDVLDDKKELRVLFVELDPLVGEVCGVCVYQRAFLLLSG